MDTGAAFPGAVRNVCPGYGIEMVKDKGSKETFEEDESERLLRGFMSKVSSTPGSTALPTTVGVRSCSWPLR